MLYIYDILVNFIDGNRIYEFFEWNSNDVVEHIKKIPLIKVDNITFYDLIYNDIKVSIDLLELIKNKTYTYNGKIEYAGCFTNGSKCYVLEFNNNGEVLFKSSLLIDEEDEVILCSKKLVNIDFSYDVINCLEPIIYLNTRSEERKINIIKKDLEYSLNNKNYAKINYLYSEIYNDNEKDVNNKYNKIINNLNSNTINKIYNIISLEHKKKKAI